MIYSGRENNYSINYYSKIYYSKRLQMSYKKTVT